MRGREGACGGATAACNCSVQLQRGGCGQSRHVQLIVLVSERMRQKRPRVAKTDPCGIPDPLPVVLLARPHSGLVNPPTPQAGKTMDHMT